MCVERIEDANLAMTRRLAALVEAEGGKSYFVGGYVRDHLLGIDNKDIDVEIHGLSVSRLKELLDQLGERREDGADYGIYGLAGYEIDIALPRKEIQVGSGHKAFEVRIDPFMGTKEAAIRRDFTMNALMQDVVSGEIVDHFGGMEDMKNHILHMVNEEAFGEDPLRALRGAQFAARFACRLSDETLKMCSGMDLSTLAKERVFGEMKKALLKADKPSIFFEELRRMNQLSFWFPELEALIGVEQNPVYHPEGDVWNHTMCVINEAAKRREAASDPLSFMLAALFHDIGKASTSQVIDGVIRAFGHEKVGAAMVEEALSRLTTKVKYIRYVENMVLLHMRPNQLVGQGSGRKAYFRLYDEAREPEDLILLSQCDMYGKLPEQITEDKIKEYERYESIEKDFLEEFHGWMSKPYVKGEDLVKAGLKPGKEFSEILQYAHKLRLGGVDKEKALAETLSFARRYKKKD